MSALDLSAEWNPESLRRERDALRSELAAYRSAVVPSADYHRVLERAEHAERRVDALTGELANSRDTRQSALTAQATGILARVMRTLAGVAGGPEERAAWGEARAWLAEQGVVSPEVEEMRAAYEAREQERQGR